MIDVPGLWDGLVHPVLGIDHLVAMCSVGVVSAVLGPRAIWSIPAAFVVSMAVGGVVGLNSFVLPRTELWIAISLIALGLMIATGGAISVAGRRLPFWLAVVFVATFGAAHGNAHGVEIPATASPVAFTIGFLTGTTALHVVGVIAGLSSLRHRMAMVVMRMAGVFAAALGIGLLTR